MKYTKISGKQDKMHHGFAKIRSWKTKVSLLRLNTEYPRQKEQKASVQCV